MVNIERLYVFAYLDGVAVPAGVLERTGLVWPPKARSARFAYGRGWLERKNAFAIDPFHLPLIEGWQDAPEKAELHGVFKDAAPDGWGKTLIDKRYPNTQKGLIEYLAAAGADRIGCLGFGPDLKQGPTSIALDDLGNSNPGEDDLTLPALMLAADLMEKREALPERLNLLLLYGSALGGARAKANFRDSDHHLWIAKFPMRDDLWDMARIEAACLDMAADAGIATPAHKIIEIGGRAVLLVERFDRVKKGDIEHRLAYLSGETALDVTDDKFYAGKSYEELCAAGRKLGYADAGLDVYRRLLLNTLIHNTDDHLRNHAFLRSLDGKWAMSPVYDLTPHQSEKSVLSVGGRSEPDVKRAKAAYEALGVPQSRAAAAFDEVLDVTIRWQKYMEDRGVSQNDLNALAPFMPAVNKLKKGNTEKAG
jgi:serine/threonine-protein kinase HipA